MKLLSRAGLIALVAALGLGSLAIAQVPSLILTSPTGLEQVEVLVPSTTGIVTSPQKVQVTLNQIRNASGNLLVAAGTTVSTTVPNTAAKLLATGAITTWNVALPVAPMDGQDLTIACPGGNVGTLTITAVSPTAIVGTNPTSCTAATPTTATFSYSLSANVWYRAS